MSNQTLYQKKQKLLKKDKHCHWCSCEMILVKPAHGERYPDNLATIDHVDSKPVRGFATKTKKVLACHACNRDRNTKDRKANPEIYEKHRAVMEAKHQLEKIISLTGVLVDMPALLYDVGEAFI